MKDLLKKETLKTIITESIKYCFKLIPIIINYLN